MTTLSKHWARATLNELIATDGLFADGDWVESKDQDPQGAIRLLQLADIGEGAFLNKSNRFINEEKFVKLRCTELRANDVLIARMPDPLGRACMMPELPQRCVTVVDVAVVRPGSLSVLPAWLMYVLNSPMVRQEIEVQSSGTTRRRISRGNLGNMELPIPPLAEQTRIANKLDAVLARVDACRDRLDRIPAILKRFRQSVLAAATSGKLTRDWREANFAEGSRLATYAEISLADLLAEPTRNGRSVRDGDGTPVLRLTALQGGDIDTTASKAGEWTGINIDRFLIKAGDFLVARGNGSRELVGRGGLVKGSPKDVAFPDTMIRVRVDKTLILPRFLRLIWDTPAVRRQIELTARTTAGIWKIAQPDLERLKLPVPPPAEQAEIVRRVESLFAFADRLEARYAIARAQVEKLTPATLAKAFRGELVLQDPSDEPADVLLERIRAKRGDTAADNSKRGRKSPQARNHEKPPC